MVNWNIELLDGIESFLLSLSSKEQAKAAWLIDLLEKTGTNLREPYAKYLKNGIWELRPAKQIRILYCLNKDTFIILHAFKKKTRKILKNETALAEKRKKECFERRSK
ncbi:MAG: type II toxin-antitoxin system RelE/ParE family toxin [Armatimonadetes bacterium]|nr:type II toxin-antitoxin system RelE/ParE family toxin [Armatimonadota bacterium]